MTVGKAIYNILTNDATVSGIVGINIFPELAPPKTNAPYIVYSVLSNSPSDVKEDGGRIDVANIEVYNFQTTYTDAIDLGVAVRNALDRKSGSFTGVKLQSIQYSNEQMDVNETRQLWASVQDYSIRILNN